jgi:hypothetical protein
MKRVWVEMKGRKASVTNAKCKHVRGREGGGGGSPRSSAGRQRREERRGHVDMRRHHGVRGEGGGSEGAGLK